MDKKVRTIQQLQTLQELFPIHIIINRWVDDYDFPSRIINWHGIDIPNFLKQ